jgi:hypothetical protein
MNPQLTKGLEMRELTEEQENVVNLMARTNPLTETVLKQAFEAGMIAKADLKDEQYYLGSCRNASVAVWDERRNCFYYQRHKFADIFAEGINHPEDENGYDLFIPFYEVEPKEGEHVPEDER